MVSIYSLLYCSGGKHDVASIRLLEYWRSKNPEAATYKALFDALKVLHQPLVAQNVYNSAPTKFSTDTNIEPSTPPASPVLNGMGIVPNRVSFDKGKNLVDRVSDHLNDDVAPSHHTDVFADRIIHDPDFDFSALEQLDDSPP